MLDNLAPARRRLVLGLVVLVVLAVVAVVAGLLLTREPAVTPVAQDTPGPVVLVPGYGGSTQSVQPIADALEAEGRTTAIYELPGDGRGDLRAQASGLADLVDQTLADSGADSVDVVGYSAGGVVVRLWAADDGGAAQARRIVSLSSPQHGTDLATVAGDVAPGACSEACVQLGDDSDLLRELNAGDETPAGPLWIALWTDNDTTVVPPTSGSLDGALDFSMQSVCPDLVVAHPDVPADAAVIKMVVSVLGTSTPETPSSAVCS